jgi:hypothetical protein
MKFRFILITLLALIVFPSISQSQIVIGIKSGFSDAWQDYGAVPLPPDAETHIKGYNVSLEVYKPINKYLRLGIEPGFVKRGAACVPGWDGRGGIGIDPIFIGDTRFLINYVELPVNMMFSLPVFKSNFTVFVKGGYGVSVVASAVEEKIYFRGGEPTDQIDRTPIVLGENSILNRWDHGVYAGAGLSYSLQAHSIFLEYDFYAGQRDAERFNTSRNRVADFSAGYRFEFGQ